MVFNGPKNLTSTWRVWWSSANETQLQYKTCRMTKILVKVLFISMDFFVVVVGFFCMFVLIERR